MHSQQLRVFKVAFRPNQTLCSFRWVTMLMHKLDRNSSRQIDLFGYIAQKILTLKTVQATGVLPWAMTVRFVQGQSLA